MARTQVKSGGFIQDPSLAYSVSVSLHHPTRAVSALLNTGPFSNAAAGYSAWENAPHTNTGLLGRSMTTYSGTVVWPGADAGGFNVWIGSTWLEKPAKVWTGTAWLAKPVKVWNGSAWE
jgi:hypothetical protein